MDERQRRLRERYSRNRDSFDNYPESNYDEVVSNTIDETIGNVDIGSTPDDIIENIEIENEEIVGNVANYRKNVDSYRNTIDEEVGNIDYKSYLSEKYSQSSNRQPYNHENESYGYDYNMQKNSFSLSKKTIGALIGAFILTIAAVVGLTFGKKYYMTYSEEKKAQNLQELEKFEDASVILNELFLKTGDPKYKEQIDYNKLLEEDKSILDEGNSYYESNSYIGAIENFIKITDKDKKYYDKAKEMLNKSIENEVRTVQQYISKEDRYSARSDVDKLALILPGDKRVTELESKVKALELKLEKQANGIYEVPVSSGGDASSLGSALIGTFQTITSGEANVRVGHSKSDAIMGSLSKGTRVYIEDTYVESAHRTWCKINYGGRVGWISYNTMNGTIR